MATLFLSGDVMTGRDVDQILAHSCPPGLQEAYVRDARDYVALAEEAHGPIPRPVSPAYIWGDALEELERAAPEARIINLETSVTTSSDFWPGKASITGCIRGTSTVSARPGGVDLIHGHSSHHPRPIEIYRDKLVLYGCGDFITDYEGITGYEQFRDDLVLMYFPRLDPDTGDLVTLHMTPLQVHQMRGWFVRPRRTANGCGTGWRMYREVSDVMSRPGRTTPRSWCSGSCRRSRPPREQGVAQICHRREGVPASTLPDILVRDSRSGTGRPAQTRVVRAPAAGITGWHMVMRDIPRAEWGTFLDGFARQHRDKPVTVAKSDVRDSLRIAERATRWWERHTTRRHTASPSPSASRAPER